VTQALKGSERVLASVLILALVLVLAACLRLYRLLPVERGLQFPQDYDEAVWDSTAQLMLQGYLPYRDFFATLPPVGIYLLAAVLRLFGASWGNAVGFMATRYASVLYGLATIVTVHLVGRKLAGRPAGLAAAALLALDGMVIGMDRRVMLEPPLNLFSVLALLAYFFVFERTRDNAGGRRLAILAGFLSALAALAKTPGMVVVLSLVTVSLLRRRFREAAIIAVTFGLSWVTLSACFLLRCPSDFLKQVYFFQVLRPADGITRWTTRLYDIWHYTSAWLTVRAGLAGAFLVGSLATRRREARPWLVVLVWMGYTLGLIIINKSYWPQYYVQLAVPLSLLGGGLLDRRVWPISSLRGAARRVRWLTLGSLSLLAISLTGLAGGAAASQWTSILGMLDETSHTYTAIADYLSQNSPAEARILVFEPNYAFLASRPPAGAGPRHFLIDSYGEMLYANLGIEGRSLFALANAALTGEESELQSVFWRAPAQKQVLAAFEQAEYVIVDGRARYQLRPQTLAAIQARSTEVCANGPASLRERH
jgi:hypothetical protein